MATQFTFLILVEILSSIILAGESGLSVRADEASVIVPSQAGDPVELRFPESYSQQDVDYAELLQVYVGDGKDDFTNLNPIAGRYSVGSHSVKFAPMFGFVEGQDYMIRVRHHTKRAGVVYRQTAFTIQPTGPIVKPEVTAVYPSGDVLPENVLRFYLHFSTAMKPHVAMDYIKLLDASGNVDDAAFIKFKQELWSEDRKRLTVLMDPGRIKRRVATNLKLGPALRRGHTYRLVVEAGWPTANGTGQLPGFCKSFTVSDALRELPNTKDWSVIAPAVRTTNSLQIKFDRPFDRQLLTKNIKVVDRAGQEIRGNVEVLGNETVWVFQPTDPWAQDQIQLIANSELEDVAGNNFRDLLGHRVDTETRSTSRYVISVNLLEN